MMDVWKRWRARHPAVAEFLSFFLVSNGVTLLQLVLMPMLQGIFSSTALVDISVKLLPIGGAGGVPFYIFDYGAGAIANGGGGGLAYFLAVQITLLIAQVINFFLQRRVTFKSNGNILTAAAWYALAYVLITILAAAAQGFYKAPIYELFMNTLAWGSAGERVADVLTMVINSIISFWVFFPIFKIIFKEKDSAQESTAS